MPYKSRLDVETKALDILGMLTVGQPPETEDLLKVDSNWEPLLDLLAGRDIVYVGDLDNVPPAMFLPLATCLANASKMAVGVNAEEYPRLAAEAVEAEAQLRQIMHGRPTYQPFRMESF